MMNKQRKDGLSIVCFPCKCCFARAVQAFGSTCWLDGLPESFTDLSIRVMLYRQPQSFDGTDVVGGWEDVLTLYIPQLRILNTSPV
jgi:hypothetical protein